MTLLAIVAIHTAANEPPKVRQVMNKIHRNVGFRGTDSDAGEDNILRMYRNWILEKMEAQLQDSWRLLAKLLMNSSSSPKLMK